MPRTLFIASIAQPEIVNAALMSIVTVCAVLGITVIALLWTGVYIRAAVNALLLLSASAFIGCVAKLGWTLIG